MTDSALPVALNAVRHCAERLADAVLHAEIAQQHLAIALKSAQEAGATSDDIARQAAHATAGNVERADVLARLAVFTRTVGEEGDHPSHAD